jgi:hypothetical protein
MRRAPASRTVLSAVTRLARSGLAIIGAPSLWGTGVARTSNTFTVTNNSDHDPGSLRTEVGLAGVGDTIVIPSSIPAITLLSPIPVNQGDRASRSPARGLVRAFNSAGRTAPAVKKVKI